MTKTKPNKINTLTYILVFTYFVLATYATLILVDKFFSYHPIDENNTVLPIIWAIMIGISTTVFLLKNEYINKYFVIPFMGSMVFCYAFLNLDYFNNTPFEIFGFRILDLIMNYSWISFIVLGFYLIKISTSSVKFKQIFHIFLTAAFISSGVYVCLFVSPFSHANEMLFYAIAWVFMTFFAITTSIFLRKEINKNIAIFCIITMALNNPLFILTYSSHNIVFATFALALIASYLVFGLHSAMLFIGLYQILKKTGHSQ